MRSDFRVLTVRLLCCAAILAAPPVRELPASEPELPTVAEWIKGQITDGRLSVEFYDPAKPPKPYPGWTEFDFRLEYRYDYQTEWTQKKGAKVAVVITPRFNTLDFPVKHRIQLPMHLKSERWWEAGLARHELDHVRVGMHPRLAMLGKHLISRVQRLERITSTAADVTPEWVARQLDAEMAPRRDAVQALVLRINRKIDALTNHGATPLPDRDAFQANLYLKENLDEMKFAYLPEVLDLIGRRDYVQARLQIRDFDEPASSPEK